MPYVRRNQAGEIAGYSRWPNERYPEQVTGQEADVQAFLEREPPRPKDLAELVREEVARAMAEAGGP